MNETPPIDAGRFGPWLSQALRVLRGEAEADVPCGSCTGCCTSAYYIRIRARDRMAVAGFSPAYFVRTLGMPNDEVLMGWRSDGTCPALDCGQCTIYAQRPMTCRDYDCRVFVPAGLEAGDERKAVINERVRAWRFAIEDETEQKAFDAIRRAATFIRDKRSSFPNEGRGVPTAPTGVAVLAMKTHEVFLQDTIDSLSDEQISIAVVEASRRFDASEA